MPAHRIRGASRLKVLVVASQKGGSGETTLAGHLAVQAELRGEGPVGLIDVDPQGSLADWWNERTAPNPFFIQTAVPRLADDIRELEIGREAGRARGGKDVYISGDGCS